MDRPLVVEPSRADAYALGEPLRIAALRCGGWGLTPRMWYLMRRQLRMGRLRRVADAAPSGVGS